MNLAKVATGVVAGVSHWRFKNIDKGLVLSLAIPGVVGALVGVTILSNVNSGIIKPLLAVLLSVIGLRILFRFARLNSAAQSDASESEDQPTTRPNDLERGKELRFSLAPNIYRPGRVDLTGEGTTSRGVVSASTACGQHGLNVPPLLSTIEKWFWHGFRE